MRDILPYDIAIIGAGPAGLAAAIRLRQLDTANKYTICVIEKAAQIGGHSLAGAVMDPAALDKLLPNWRELDGFPAQGVTADRFAYLSKTKSITLPTPPQMKNHGNYIVSLSHVVRFLADHAQAMNIDVLPGFAAQEALVEGGKVTGVRTGDFGVEKDGTPGPGHTPGPDIKAQVTIFTEGCRGHITKTLVKTFGLDKGKDPQTYAQGVKEIWQVNPQNHKAGQVTHTIGWPLDGKTYGGGWVYHLADSKVSIGFVVGLDYADSGITPTALLQKYKTHPHIAKLLEGGELLHAGARALYEGGIQGQYHPAMPGALLAGDGAGTLNVPRIKGIHTAMGSGMLAAEATYGHLEQGTELDSYATALASSWVGHELHSVRNIRPGFKFGLLGGLANAAFETVTQGKAPWTLHTTRPDHEHLKKIGPDGVHPTTFDTQSPLTIDRLTGVNLTHTAHNEAQPVHLKVADPDICVTRCTAEYGNPCTRFCPAGVYEIVGAEEGKARLQVNSANCIHCKTCDIKDPYAIITWTAPEGGSGPNYTEM